MATPKNLTRRHIPSVDDLLRHDGFKPLLAEHGRSLVRDEIRAVLGQLRGESGRGAVTPKTVAEHVSGGLERLMAPSLKPVFNLTGTILHTNLGRAPLPKVAIDAMVAAAGAVNLEYDLDTGGRGQRDKHLEDWIIRLTGAEAAIAVNNNAAAVLIALNTLALGKDVIISRGELIEIGGAFRMPDIMARAGCNLCEVGTTNRTHNGDFSRALGPETGMILKVHTSNFQVQGFTKVVPERDLADLARTHLVPFVVDLGSGTLIDLVRFGLPHETTVRETLQNGADLVTFSGDKLLGGPQAGIIAGRADLIDKIAENPMKRAMRLDKITIAALAAVLRLYGNPDRLADHLPTLRLLGRTEGEIKLQADRMLPPVSAALTEIAKVRIAKCQSQIGSGALPVNLLDSYCLTLTPLQGGDTALRNLGKALRKLPRPVIGRTHNGNIDLDLRALEQENVFISQIETLEV